MNSGRNGENGLEIRAERPGDIATIAQVNRAAFGQPDEAELVDALRRDPDAWLPNLSLVALRGERIVGHLLISRVRLDGPDGADAASLAPMAVLPELQRDGVGSALVRHGLTVAAGSGERLVVVLGHAGYYPRFGFLPARPLGVHSPYEVDDEHWMAIDLTGIGGHPRGTVAYPAAFGSL